MGKVCRFRCLICNTAVFKEDEVKIEEEHKETQSILNVHLAVIYVLRNILQFPTSDLADLLKASECVENWEIEICGECNKIIRKSQKLFQELLKFQRKLETCQLRIVERVKKSFKSNEKAAPETGVSRRIRKFVVNHTYGELNQISFEESIKLFSKKTDIDLHKAVATVKIEEEANNFEENEPPISYNDDNEDEDLHTLDDKDDNDWTVPGSCIENNRDTEETKTKAPLICPEPNCNKSFQIQAALTRHLAFTHGKGNLFKCSTCPKTFIHKTTLWLHEEKAHQKRFPELKCNQCSYRCRARYSLAYHKQRVHPPCGKAPALKHCSVAGCSEKFASRKAYGKHLKVNHSLEEKKLSKRRVCPDCGKILASPQYLKEHLKMVHASPTNPNTFICECCATKFPSKSCLDAHLRNTLKCKRNRMSDVEATIICDICGKCLANQLGLRRHIKTVHHKVYGAVCKICGKGFVYNSKLRVHLANTHNVIEETGNEFKCKEDGCSRIFFQKKKLEYHVLQTHKKGEPGYVCKICGGAYYTPYNLYHHENKVHKIKQKTSDV